MNVKAMQRPGLSWLACAVVSMVALSVGAGAVEREALRVCADPNNLPFSHKNGTGFENRLAEIWAEQLELPLEYTWFPQRRGFVRNTLRAPAEGRPGYKCDVIVGVATGFDEAITTKPYYWSTYALVYVKGRKLDGVATGADLIALPMERRDALKIGVFSPSPGTDWLARHGMTEQMVAYPVMSGDPDAYPGQLIETELSDGRLDAVIVWGPIGGYFATRVAAPLALAVVPLRSEPGIRFHFGISAGVRFGEGEAKQELESLIEQTAPQIEALMESYRVPLVSKDGEPL